MSPLDRKLLRDLWRLRGQVLAIGMVIASGVGLLVMSLTAIEALQETADAYYERYRFAQVFARVKRAPEYMADRLATIEGVQSVNPDDLEITKEGGEAVITAAWSTKVPIIGNFSACLDFTSTTAK